MVANEAMREEEMIAALYSSLGSERSAFIDVGANYGWHTRRMLDIASDGLVVAVEANPTHVTRLVEKFKSNTQLKIVSSAVVPDFYEADRGVSFKRSELHHGRGGIEGLHIWELIDPGIDFDKEWVSAVCFSDLIAQAGPRLDFIKMDIEGPEYSILLSNTSMFELESRPVVALENSVHGMALAKSSFDDFYAHISKFDYALCCTTAEIRSEQQRRNAGQTTYLAPKEKTASVMEILEGFQ